MDDKRKTVKLNPDVAEKWDELIPDGMTQSEFVDKLLEDADIEREISIEDIRRVVRDELERQTDELTNRR